MNAVQAFHPGSTELFDDFLAEAGDVIQIISDGQSFDLPIFSQHMEWFGNMMNTVQSTGNKERSALPPLQKKQRDRSYGAGQRMTQQEEQLHGYYVRSLESDRTWGMLAGACGVKLDADGNPMKDEDGDFIWDDENGATIYSRLMLTSNRAELVSAINDGQGNQISGSKIDLSAQGTVLIQAINNRPDSASTVIIEADKVDLRGLVTFTQLEGVEAKIDRITGDTVIANTLVNADTLSGWHLAITQDSSLGSATCTGLSVTSRTATTHINPATIDSSSGYFNNLYLGSNSPSNPGRNMNEGVIGFGTASPSGGAISIPYYTFASGTSTQAGTINFNIADTAYYQSHVGIASVSQWAWDTEEESYITIITPNAGSTRMVYPPTITTPVTSGNASWNDSTWTKSVNIGIKGPATSGITHDLANGVSISVSENWRERVIASDGKSLSMTIKFTHGVTSLGNVTLTGIGNTIYTNGHTDGVTEGTATGRRLGWNAAIDKVVIPSTQSTSDTMIVKVPVKNPASYTDPAMGSYGFSLDSDNDYVYILNEDDIVVARATNKKTGGTPLATQIDMQVGSASQSPPSAPSGTGSTMVFASTFSSLIDQYASQSGGPWYIPFDITISGGTGTKRYYVRING